MKMMERVHWLALGILLITVLHCSANTFATCTSSYLSNGWFRYDLTLCDDPFFTEVSNLGLSVPVSNPAAIGPVPLGWTNFVASRGTSWHSMSTSAISRPQTVSLYLQSPFASYRSESGTVSFVASVNDLISPYTSANMAGYGPVACLIPCPPGETNGAPPEINCKFEIVPDVHIQQFLFLTNRLHGLSFSWCHNSTMQLQSSSNLINWTNTTYILGYPDTTTWTSSVPMDTLGKYFRLLLISNKHHPELIP